MAMPEPLGLRKDWAVGVAPNYRVRRRAKAPTASISRIFVAADFLAHATIHGRAERQQAAQHQVAARQVLKVHQTNKQAVIVCSLWSQDDPQQTLLR